MDSYAFFSRVLAILILVIAFLSVPLSIQHFRLKNKITQAQNILQDTTNKQMVLGNMMPELLQRAQKDPALNALFQKYGLSIPIAQEQPKPKKK